MAWSFDSLPDAGRKEEWDFDSLPAAANPEKQYSELSNWDLLKAGDVKGLLGRTTSQNQQQDLPSDVDIDAFRDVSGAYGNTDYETQGRAELAPTQEGIQANLRRDITEWGNTVANDITSDDVGAWQTYEDLARPAGMAAVTPFLPGYVRGVAGAIYLPKFGSDVINTFQENRSGETTGEEQGVLQAMGNTVKNLVYDPLAELGSTIVNDPSGLAERIKEHPSALWDEVLMPASLLEIPARAGKAAHSRYQESMKALDEIGERLPQAPEGGNITIPEWMENTVGDAALRHQEQVGNGMYDSGHIDIDPIVDEAAKEYGLSPEFVHAVIEQESGYDPYAVSDAGAKGLMQLMPGTAAELGVTSVFDPRENIHGGASYLRQMLDRFEGDERKALAAYNAGPGNWEAGLGYADEVLGRMNRGGEEVGLEPLTDKYYTVLDEVSDTGITELTEQKLNYLARDYQERYGEPLEITSMKRNGDGSSWHDSGQAVDMVADRLARDPEARAWLMEQGEKYGLVGLDEYANPSAHATGLHMHFSDHGDPIPGGAGRRSSHRVQMGEPRQQVPSSPTGEYGEMKDMFGREAESLYEDVDKSVDNLQGKAEEQGAVAKVNWGDESLGRMQQAAAGKEKSRVEAEMSDFIHAMMDDELGEIPRRGRETDKTAKEARQDYDPYMEDMREGWKTDKERNLQDLRAQREVMEEEHQQYISDEVQRMKENPGGKGVNVGYTYEHGVDERGRGQGRITGRFAESNNPEWYQEFYKRYGRAPREGELEQFARESLMENEDFANLDRGVRRAREYENRIAEAAPPVDINRIMDEVDSEIQYSKGKRQSTGKGATTGGYTEDTITSSEYFDGMRRLFGTLRLGRNPAGAEGSYNKQTDVARANGYKNYDTMWHEIGHRLDNQYGLRGKAGNAAMQEFANAMQRKYGANVPYKPHEIPGEGIAEFIKDYVNDPATARQNFPSFSKTFEDVMKNDKDLADRIKEAQEMTRVEKNQGDWAQVAGDIAPARERGWKQRIKDFFSNPTEEILDAFWKGKAIDKMVEDKIGRKLSLEESLYANARLAESRGIATGKILLEDKDGERAARMIKDETGVDVNPVTFRMALDKLGEAEKDAGFQQFLKDNKIKDAEQAIKAYLVASRFKEVHDYMTAKTGHEYQMPRDYATYDRITQTAPAKLKEAAQMMWDLNDNLLKLMVHGGLLSQAGYKALRQRGQHYCSLAREFPDDAGVVQGMQGHGFINVANPIKKLKEYGSMWDVQDPLQNFESNIGRVCNLVERNKVGQILTDFASKPGMGEIAEKVKDPAKARDSSFKVWRDGKQEVYQTSPEVYRFMQALRPQGAASFVDYLSRLPARWMRAGATVANVAFGGVNMLRDTATASILSKYNFIPIYDTLVGMYHMARKDDVWEGFKRGGVEFSTDINAANGYSSKVLSDFRKNKARRAAEWGLNFLARQEDFNNIMENATRIGLYNRAIKSGASQMEAIMEAREGTLDFGRGGKTIKEWNKSIPFLNAAVQGNLLFYERCRRQPAKMAARLGVMAMASLALQAYIRSDDEYSKLYDQLHDYEKNMFWMVPGRDEEGRRIFNSIPKPFTEGMIGASLPVAMVEQSLGNDKRAMARWGKEFVKSMVPIFPIDESKINPAIKTIFEELANYDTFRKRSIVPESEKKMSPEFQYDPNTSEFAKWAGSKTGLSPRRIDHVGSGLFAGAYTNATKVTDPIINPDREFDNPITRRFKRDPMRSPQSVQDYYDRKTQLETAYNDRKMGKEMSKEDMHDYQVMKAFDKAVTKFSDQIKIAKKRGDRGEIERLTRLKNEFIMNNMDKFQNKY